MSWAEEKMKMLAELTEKGMSASQIAAEIGDGCTRNAVVGKWHRGKGKLPRPVKVRTAPVRQATRLPNAQRAVRSVPNARAARAAKVVTKAPQIDGAELAADMAFDPSTPLEASAPVSLMDRRPGQCCFPLAREEDRPPYLFCGAVTVDDTSSYCITHRLRMRRAA